MNKHTPASHKDQINAIHQLLRQMLNQTEQLKVSGRPLHQLDKDLLIRQTQELYEWLFITEKEDTSKPEAEYKPVAEPVKPKPEQEFSEETEDLAIDAETPVPIAPKTNLDQTKEPEPSNPEVTNTSIQKETTLPKKSEESLPKVSDIEKETAIKTPSPQPTSSYTAQPKPTPLELFSQETPPSVADHLKNNDDASVAAKMERLPIEDLRTAIGINDKFLMINELFSGSLEAYNKMLDELNEFKSFNGASTFLIELKVEKQWDSNLPAWRKLVQLLERKFNVKPEDHAL